eukprot:scaffold198547_cov19-Tisochrysis_lutea.AAC.1
MAANDHFPLQGPCVREPWNEEDSGYGLRSPESWGGVQLRGKGWIVEVWAHRQSDSIFMDQRSRVAWPKQRVRPRARSLGWACEVPPAGMSLGVWQTAI